MPGIRTRRVLWPACAVSALLGGVVTWRLLQPPASASPDLSVPLALAGPATSRPSSTSPAFAPWTTDSHGGNRLTVLQVVDGSTFDVRDETGAVARVRVAGIDAPAPDQPYGEAARRALEALVNTPNATLDFDTLSDGIPRRATVRVNGQDVAGALIDVGAATLASDSIAAPGLRTRQDEARAAQRGLWALPPDQRIPRCGWEGTC